MKNYKRLVSIVTILMLVTFVMVGCGGGSGSEGPSGETEKPESIALVSGTPGGSWFPIGAAIAEIYSGQGVKANAEPGGGVSNVATVSQGKADLGFTMTIIPTLAKNGEEPFTEKQENVAGIGVLFPNFTHVMVSKDAGIDSISDLKGKAFVTQPVGQATQVAFRDLLATVGLTESDLDLSRGSQSEGVQLMKDNHVVGLTATTAAPSGALTELAATKDIKFLGVSDELLAKIRQINTGYVRMIMKANTYPGQTEDVIGMGTDTILIVRKDMPEEQVYWLTKTLAENLEMLRQTHKVMADLDLEALSKVSGLPLHPGAERYYKEAGVMK